MKDSRIIVLIIISFFYTFSCSEKDLNESVNKQVQQDEKETNKESPVGSNPELAEEFIISYEDGIDKLTVVSDSQIKKNIFGRKNWSIENVYKYKDSYLLFVTVTDTQKGKFVFLNTKYVIEKEIDVELMVLSSDRYTVLNNKLYCTNLVTPLMMSHPTIKAFVIDLKKKSLTSHNVRVKKFLRSSKNELYCFDYSNSLYKVKDTVNLSTTNNFEKLVQFDSKIEDIVIDKNNNVWAYAKDQKVNGLILFLKKFVEFKMILYKYDLDKKELSKSLLNQKYVSATNLCCDQKSDSVVMVTYNLGTKGKMLGTKKLCVVEQAKSGELVLNTITTLTNQFDHYEDKQIFSCQDNNYRLLGKEYSAKSHVFRLNKQTFKSNELYEDLKVSKYIIMK
jgi:hypothetical protein